MEFEAYFGLGVLFIINTINFLDRYSLASVLDDVQKFYQLEDGPVGFLSTCFLIGYMLTAPLFGYLGDRHSRKWILVGGILFWCLACFIGSVVPKEYTFFFFLSRMLVGVGEACYSSIAPTIIADLFAPDMRKLALSIFYFAIPIGSGLGFLMGLLASRVLSDWRWIFRITPIIGLASTALLVILKEPVRGKSEKVAMSSDNDSVMDNIHYLLSIRSYVWATIGLTCCLFNIGALAWWAIKFMVVTHGKEYENSAQMIFGGIVCLAGFTGVTLGSVSAQYFRRIDARADALVCGIGVFVAIPFTFFGLVLAKHIAWLAWIFLFLSVTALSTNWAIVSDMLLTVTVPSKRAFAGAIQIFISHLLGDAASPFISGSIRDLLRKMGTDDHSAFLYSLLSTLIFLFLGAFAFLKSAKYYVQDTEACKRAMNSSQDSDETLPDAAGLTDFAGRP